jgi:protein MAK11
MRLALSVCKEKKLRLWNLLTGRCNYTSTLTEASRILLWSPAGDAYVVSAGKALRVHALAGAGEPVLLRHDSPPLAAAFAAPSVLASGCADGLLYLWDAATGARIGSPTRAHAARLKALVAVNLAEGEPSLCRPRATVRSACGG